MIPAGYLPYKGDMGLWQVISLGIAGSLAGALVNYYLAIQLGRPLILRYGKYAFVGPEAVAKVDLFFEKHGEIATFNGRFIPVIRQLISLRAGLARMYVSRFALYTSLGAGIWVTAFAMIGYFLGSQEEPIRLWLRELTIAAIAFVSLTSVIYFFWRRKPRSCSIC